MQSILLMARVALFLIVVTLGLCCFLAGMIRSRRQLQPEKSRSLFDYFLLWPLIFDQPARKARVASGERLFTTGEIVGMTVFVVMLAIGLIFF